MNRSYPMAIRANALTLVDFSNDVGEVSSVRDEAGDAHDLGSTYMVEVKPPR